MRKRFFLLALFLALALPVLSFAADGDDGGLNVCDLNNDGVRDLSDIPLYATCVDTFDVNGDGVHDLTDVSLYASNNQSNSWCQTNFNCTAAVMTNSSYASSTNPGGLAVCDINNDGVRNLSDVTLYAGCVGTFDVNGDGVHDLTDISLYATNNQDNTWCQANFRCTPASGTDLTITDITNYPVIPKVGEDVYISLLILNSGSTVLTNTAGILNNYKYFQDFTAGMPDVIPTISATNPLNPGEATHITWKGSFTSAGAKSLQATVDNANELVETNENNNNYSTTINVSSETALAVCDLNYDGVSNLSDVPLFANCQSTFDVNNDGVHNLTDVSLYSSNYQSSSWCRANFRCEPNASLNLNVWDSRITKLSPTSLRVYWAANIASIGQYRYSKTQSMLSNLPWRTDGVSSDPAVTGNMFFGNQVDLTGLEINTTYYIEVRQKSGTQYGVVKFMIFKTDNVGLNLLTNLVEKKFILGQTYLLEWQYLEEGLYPTTRSLDYATNLRLYKGGIELGKIANVLGKSSGINSYSWDLSYSNDNFVTRKTAKPGNDYQISFINENTGINSMSVNFSIISNTGDDNDDVPAVTGDATYYNPLDVNTLLANLQQNRNIAEEAKFKQLALASGKKFGVTISEDFQNQAATFVTYGIDDNTKNFGSGERLAILADYFDNTGYAQIKWDDVARLANGAKPVGRNLAKEQAQVARALKTFEAIYGHKPNFKDAKEDLFWNTLMYRIRFDRDLAKEKVGIAKFQEIFGKTPSTPYDWSVVRALGYIK